MALLALCLSGLALYRQRPQPRLEGSVVKDLPTGFVAVAVRNGGHAAAKTCWFVVAIDDRWIFAHVGRGFVGSGEGRYAITTAAIPDKLEVAETIGVVGCVDPKGHDVVWPLSGRRGKRFRRRFLRRNKRIRTHEEMFRHFYGDAKRTAVGGIQKDEPLAD